MVEIGSKIPVVFGFVCAILRFDMLMMFLETLQFLYDDLFSGRYVNSRWPF